MKPLYLNLNIELRPISFKELQLKRLMVVVMQHSLEFGPGITRKKVGNRLQAELHRREPRRRRGGFVVLHDLEFLIENEHKVRKEVKNPAVFGE